MTTTITTRFVLLWIGAFACAALAQSEGAFTASGNMLTPRAGHSATLLQNGKVLIAGGISNGSYLASAELYDPATGTFTGTGSMTTARELHRAILLADGRVLITGGAGGTDQSPAAISAEIYDPSSGSFSATGDMIIGQGWHAATLLGNGSVLIAGNGESAQVYDPVAGRFTLTGPYAGPTEASFISTATLLAGGKVLVTGCTEGCSAGMEQTYDPDTNSFSITGGADPGCGTDICWFPGVNTATLLLDGRTLIAGSGDDDFPAEAEIYDASAGAFTSIGNTAAPHEFSTATLLPDGRVLIAGSQLPGGSGDPTAELYDPGSGQLAAAGNMTTGRHSHTATLLPDGTVLIAGGFSAWPGSTASVEIYRPALGQQTAMTPFLLGDAAGQAAIQHAGTYRLVSGNNPAAAGEVLVVYCTGLADGGVIPPQVAIGGRMAEVLWFGKTPGFVGLNQINVRVPNGITPGPAVGVRLNYLSRPSNEVTIAVQ